MYAIFFLSAFKEDLEGEGEAGRKSLDLQTTIRQVNILQFHCSQENTERKYLRKNKPESLMLITELAISNSSGVSPSYLNTNNITAKTHLALFRIN